MEPHTLTRAVNRLCKRLKVPTGSPHDFWRTGATTLTSERFGVRRFIVGKVLGHTAHEGPAVTAVYDRHEYLSDKRHALEAWGRHVAALRPPSAPAAPAASPPPLAVRRAALLLRAVRRSANPAGAQVIDLFAPRP